MHGPCDTPNELVVVPVYQDNVNQLVHFVQLNIASFQHFHPMPPNELAYNHVCHEHIMFRNQIFPQNLRHLSAHFRFSDANLPKSNQIIVNFFGFCYIYDKHTHS